MGGGMADREVPEDFAAFATKYGRRLTAACREITGNDRVADAMRVDLLASVALSWRWRPASWRTRHALTQLDRLLRREVRSYRLLPTATGQIRMSASDDVRARRLDDENSEDTAKLTDAAWRRAAVLRRHSLIGVAAAALVLLGFAFIGPEAAPLPDPPSPDPTATPDEVTVLPRFGELLGRVEPRRSPLPTRVDLDPAAVAALPQLASSPLARALAVAEPNRGRLIVIGDDDHLRRIDDPILAGARLVTTSLSPAGDLIALPSGADLLVIDVRTGRIQPVPVGAKQPELPALVWRTGRRVLMPGASGALEVDVVTGETSAIAGVTGTDVVTVQGLPQPTLVEMLSGASIGSGRSRIRFWRTPPEPVPLTTTESSAPGSPSTTPPPSGTTSPSGSPSPSSSPPRPATGDFDERPVFGPTWIGDWRGPAWSSALLYVRACSPDTLRLPADVGDAWAAIGALQPNGRHAGTLVTIDNTQLEILGFLQANQLLVAAMSSGATVLLGWTPIEEEFLVIATLTDAVRMSVSDLLQPS